MIADRRSWRVEQTYALQHQAQLTGHVCVAGWSTPHPQTIMAIRLADEIPPVKYGYPFKIRIRAVSGLTAATICSAAFDTGES